MAAIILDSNGPGAMALTVMACGQALRQVPGQVVHGGLAGRVRVGLEQRDVDAVDRADVDDPGRVVGGAGGLEHGHEGAGQVERAFTLRSSTRSHASAELGQRCAPRGAGVVDQDVEPGSRSAISAASRSHSASVDRSAGRLMQVPTFDSSAATSSQTSALRDEM